MLQRVNGLSTMDVTFYTQYVAVCCSVLQCVAVCCSALLCVAVCCIVLQCVAVCCSVFQCVPVCCSVLQCVAEKVVVFPHALYPGIVVEKNSQKSAILSLYIVNG